MLTIAYCSWDRSHADDSCSFTSLGVLRHVPRCFRKIMTLYSPMFDVLRDCFMDCHVVIKTKDDPCRRPVFVINSIMWINFHDVVMCNNVTFSSGSISRHWERNQRQKAHRFRTRGILALINFVALAKNERRALEHEISDWSISWLRQRIKARGITIIFEIQYLQRDANISTSWGAGPGVVGYSWDPTSLAIVRKLI